MFAIALIAALLPISEPSPSDEERNVIEIYFMVAAVDGLCIDYRIDKDVMRSYLYRSGMSRDDIFVRYGDYSRRVSDRLSSAYAADAKVCCDALADQLRTGGAPSGLVLRR